MTTCRLTVRFVGSRRNKFLNEEGSEFGNGKCQYAVTSTIDFNGECLEDVITIDCQCGEPDSVEVSNITQER